MGPYMGPSVLFAPLDSSLNDSDTSFSFRIASVSLARAMPQSTSQLAGMQAYCPSHSAAPSTQLGSRNACEIT